MVVQCHGTVAESFLADRVERTADGLAECTLALSKSFFQGAQAAVAIVAGEHAVFTMHNAGDEVAFLIGIGHALRIDYCLSRGRQIAPYGVERILNTFNLVERYGSTGIAFYAAHTFALFVVAAELFRQQIRRNEYFAYLQDGRYLFFFHLSLFFGIMEGFVAEEVGWSGIALLVNDNFLEHNARVEWFDGKYMIG